MTAKSNPKKVVKKKEKTVLAWHFLKPGGINNDGRINHSGGQDAPKDGDTLSIAGQAILCSRGLHASRSLSDAARADTIHTMDLARDR